MEIGRHLSRLFHILKTPQGIVGALIFLFKPIRELIAWIGDIQTLAELWPQLDTFIMGGWGMLISVMIGASIIAHALFKTERKQSKDVAAESGEAKIEPKSLPDDPAARLRLIAFWQRCGKNMLTALASYCSDIASQFSASGADAKIVGALLNKYVFGKKTQDLVKRLEKIDQMTLEQQQIAISDVWDHYKELCRWIYILTERRPTVTQTNRYYRRWKSKDNLFASELGSILATGQFPIIEDRIGSVATSEELGVP